MKPKLTIQIVGWNSAKELPAALATLKTLPSEQVIIRYIDNASTDDSLALIKRELPQADIITNDQNVGFGPAHNQGFARCDTDFIMLHNPDLILSWDGVQKLLSLFDDPKIGAAQGKLLRERPAAGDSPVIDSAGIVLTSALNGRERGAGEIDVGQYDREVEILAVTGAAALYRMTALRAVAHHTPHGAEYFDHDFFAYKEDVDLGWRLTRAGWLVLYAPTLQGYHARALRREGLFNWGVNPRTVYARLHSKRTHYSLRNWLWLMLKNATLLQLIVHSPIVAMRELVMLGFTIVYPPLALAWWQAVVGLPRMLAKRRN